MHGIGKLIQDPLIVLHADLRIIEMNAAATRLFGSNVAEAGSIFAAEDQLRTLLSRAAGWGEPALGALDVNAKDHSVSRQQVVAVALRGADGVSYALTIRNADQGQFKVLTERLKELNAEIAIRQKAQAKLSEALMRNQLLYRELQHRVKNHLQMILSLISSAMREHPDIAGKPAVQGLRAKIATLLNAQQLMYEEDHEGFVRADHMLSSIANASQAMAGAQATIALAAEPLLLQNDMAFPVALIANELITNAVKHASGDPQAAITVSLQNSADGALLAVRDRGPGFVVPPPDRRSSGLGLVRGLCRQIGGRLDIISGDNGTIATVGFSIPNPAMQNVS